MAIFALPRELVGRGGFGGTAQAAVDWSKVHEAVKVAEWQRHKKLIALADEVGADKRAFCEYFKIEGIAMMPAKDFARAKIALNKKRAK